MKKKTIQPHLCEKIVYRGRRVGFGKDWIVSCAICDKPLYNVTKHKDINKQTIILMDEMWEL